MGMSITFTENLTAEQSSSRQQPVCQTTDKGDLQNVIIIDQAFQSIGQRWHETVLTCRYVLISKEKVKRSDGEIEGAEEMNVTSGRCQDALRISDP